MNSSSSTSSDIAARTAAGSSAEDVVGGADFATDFVLGAEADVPVILRGGCNTRVGATDSLPLAPFPMDTDPINCAIKSPPVGALVAFVVVALANNRAAASVVVRVSLPTSFPSPRARASASTPSSTALIASHSSAS